MRKASISGEERRDRFWTCIERETADGCWFWQGTRMGGNPYFWDGERYRSVLHIAHEYAIGPLPARRYRKKCKNKHCVNPYHAEFFTGIPIRQQGLKKRLLREESPFVEDTVNDAYFWSLIKKTSTCWIWCGKKDKTGLAVFRWYGEQMPAVCVAYEMLYDEDAPLTVRMQCQNLACCNPDHLIGG